MPFCTNPDCPHRKRHHEPAEYLQGVLTCSDCGSALSETVPVIAPLVKAKRRFAFTDFHKKLILTLLLLLFWNSLYYIGVPGINYEELTKLTHGDSYSTYWRISIIALGLMPFISAYVLVEVLALFLPPLKSWRENGYAGRANLVRTARFLTLVLALIQGYYLAQSLETMASGQVVIQPGLSFRLILMITLVAGTFITVWVADMISLWGIGHGISVLFFVGGMHSLQHQAGLIIKLYDGPQPFKYFLGVMFVVLALIVIILIFEYAHRTIKIIFDNGNTAQMPIKFTMAGLIPSEWANSLMMYPVVLAGYWGGQFPFLIELGHVMNPGGPIYYFSVIVSTILLYFMFSFFFHRNKNMLNFLSDKNAKIADEAFEKIRYTRVAMASAGALYLCFFSLLSDISSEIPLNGLELIIAVVIALDLSGEIRLRCRSGRLTKVAEFQKPSEAGVLQSLLKQNKIPCQLRGYYHRALLYFFGPYIEISVFVPEENSVRAQELISQFLKLK